MRFAYQHYTVVFFALFFITGILVSAQPVAAGIGYNKAVHDAASNSWEGGNAGGYQEAGWAKYQYTITGIDGAVPSFNVVFNHYQQSSNSIFVDAFTNFRYCVDCPALSDSQPYPDASWQAFEPLNINHKYSDSKSGACGGLDAPDSPSEFHCFRFDPSNASFQSLNPGFPSSFSSGTHTIRIYFEAHLAPTYVWSTGNENKLADNMSVYGVQAPPESVPAGRIFGADVYAAWTKQ